MLSHHGYSALPNPASLGTFHPRIWATTRHRPTPILAPFVDSLHFPMTLKPFIERTLRWKHERRESNPDYLDRLGLAVGGRGQHYYRLILLTVYRSVSPPKMLLHHK